MRGEERRICLLLYISLGQGGLGLGLLLDIFCILQPRHLEVAAQLVCMYMQSYFVND